MEHVELIVGKQRKGKSTLAYHRARFEGKPIVIFDPRGQFDFQSRGGGLAFGQGFFEEFIERSNFPVVYRATEGDVKQHFEDFVEILLDHRELAVIVDEVRFLATAQYIDENLSVLLRAYGQQGHSLYFTAHRMAHVHGDIAEPADTLIFFGTHHVLSLKKIEDATSAEAAEIVAGLKGRDFIEWSDASETFLVQRDADSWRETISPARAEKARAA